MRWPQVGLIRSFFPTNRVLPAIGTGTLIDPRGILTAAHVIFDPTRGGPADRFEVTFGRGATATADGSKGRVIPEWISAGVLDPISAYDLGVILLDKPVNNVPVADFSPSVNTDLWGHNTNVVGYPIRSDFWDGDDHALAGGEGLPVDMGPPQDAQVYRVAYPTVSLGGMSGGPVYRSDELSTGMKIRAVNTSVYNDNGNGLIIYSSLALWINSWLGELS
jgi:V8-like Glu-specific endopeptidase